MKAVHIFMISYPGQGHINPLLRLARRLAHSGLFISFCASGITDNGPTPCGRGSIRFVSYNDTTTTSSGDRNDLESFMARLEVAGREKLPLLLRQEAESGRHVSCLISNPFIPWACDVAESLGIPCAVLWVQSCASFAAYYHYYHNLVPFPTEEAPEIGVALPCMPPLKHDEFPSFLHPSSPHPFLRGGILKQFANLSKTFCVLMDTFQELENEVINYMSENCCPVMAVGPLFRGASTGPRVELYAPESCLEWLGSKSPRTVVYISFGSIVHLKQEQVEEIAHGLLESEVSFLWVVRPPPLGKNLAPHFLPEGFEERVGGRGKIVRWSPQEEVLAHPSTVCFVTHCGWNSTVEAVASGVPVVAFPQWGDQVTNAKFMVDVYGVGLRMCRGAAEGRVVLRDEVARFLKAVIGGPRAAELRENALMWKKSAEAAVAEGGSSFNNIQNFVDQLVRFDGN